MNFLSDKDLINKRVFVKIIKFYLKNLKSNIIKVQNLGYIQENTIKGASVRTLDCIKYDIKW